MKQATSILPWFLTLGLLGCPAEKVESDVPLDADVVSERTYVLGLEALTYRTSGLIKWQFDPEAAAWPNSLIDDDGPPEMLAELLVVPAYQLGIPWAEFASSADAPDTLPGAWVQSMQELREQAKASGLKIALSLNPTNLRYDNLAPQVVSDGQGGTSLQENWLNEYCPNPSANGNSEKWPSAYARYVQWMVALFEPDYVELARRINLYEENCGEARPGAYESLVGFATLADQELKLAGVSAVTVVSVDVEDLYGYPRTEGRCPSKDPKECFEERKGLLSPIEADRVGLSSYPASALSSIKELPSDWLDHVASAVPDANLVVTGLGLPGRSVETKSGVCVPLVESDEGAQRELLDQALSLAAKRSLDFVVWTAARDYYDAASVGPCVCASPKELCDHLEQLGASADEIRPQLIQGLIGHDEHVRLVGNLWMSVLEQ